MSHRCVLSRWMMGLAAGTMVAMGPIGCDEKPPTVSQSQPQQAEPETHENDGRPTTRQLIDGPRTVIALSVVPLTARVPAGWTIAPIDPLIFLEGPAPYQNADIHISMRLLSHVTAEQMASQIKGANEKAAKSGGRVRVTGPRKTGSIVLLEVQESALLASRAATQPTTAPSALVARPTTSPSTNPADTGFDWSIWTFVPRKDGSFDQYLLRFTGLENAEFQANESFLRSIIDSLEYDAHAADLVDPSRL